MGNCYQAFEVWGESEMIDTHDVSEGDFRITFQSPPRWTPESDFDFHSASSNSLKNDEDAYTLPRRIQSHRSHDFGAPRRLATLSTGAGDGFNKMTSVVQSWREDSKSPEPQLSESSYSTSAGGNTESLSADSLEYLKFADRRSSLNQQGHAAYYSFSDVVYAIDFELSNSHLFNDCIISTIKDFLRLDMKYFKSNHQIQTDMRYQCLNITLNRDGSLSKKFSFSFFSETYKARKWALQSVTQQRKNLKTYDAPCWVLVFITSGGNIVPYTDIRFHEVFGTGKKHVSADIDSHLFEKRATQAEEDSNRLRSHSSSSSLKWDF